MATDLRRSREERGVNSLVSERLFGRGRRWIKVGRLFVMMKEVQAMPGGSRGRSKWLWALSGWWVLAAGAMFEKGGGAAGRCRRGDVCVWAGLVRSSDTTLGKKRFGERPSVGYFRRGPGLRRVGGWECGFEDFRRDLGHSIR
jgi:hypothetical protein